MAKIAVKTKTGLSRELARWERVAGTEPNTYKITLLMTSDGRLLWKASTGGYSVIAKVKNPREKTEADMIALAQRYAERHGGDYRRVA